MKLFKGKIGPISKKSYRKSGKIYRGSQEVEKKKTPCHMGPFRIITRPNGNLKDQTGPNRTIQDHKGTYMTIQDNKGTYITIQDHMGP